MDSTGRIWVALDTTKKRAIEIAAEICDHPAVGGFKLNRLIDQDLFRGVQEYPILHTLNPRLIITQIPGFMMSSSRLTPRAISVLISNPII